MQIVLVTGLSGAGKSKTLEYLEDMGFYCIDNIPPTLIPKFSELCYSSQPHIQKIAMVTDVRGGNLFSQLTENLDILDKNETDYKILFLDASDKELISRYKESRRKHPLINNENVGVIEALAEERRILSNIKKRADFVIDTTNLKPFQLKEQLSRIFEQNNEDNRGLVINVVSFGFKYGTPLDSDLVFDVRFLPNPFYIEKLKNKTGLDKDVYQYVYGNDIAKEFQKKIDDLILFLLPHYIKEGKTSLVIAVGCTGGRHRSVAIAEETANTISKNGYYVVINHHDILK